MLLAIDVTYACSLTNQHKITKNIDTTEIAFSLPPTKKFSTKTSADIFLYLHKPITTGFYYPYLPLGPLTSRNDSLYALLFHLKWKREKYWLNKIEIYNLPYMEVGRLQFKQCHLQLNAWCVSSGHKFLLRWLDLILMVYELNF